MTTLVDRIKNTAKDKYGWNLKTTAQNAGIGINSIYRWKTQAPTSKSLQKVADVLNVSVDYLLGNEDSQSGKKTVELSDEDNYYTFDGKPVSKEDMDLFKRLMRGK